MCTGADREILAHLIELKAHMRANTEAIQSQSILLQELSREIGNGNAPGATRVTIKIPEGIPLPLQNFQQL